MSTYYLHPSKCESCIKSGIVSFASCNKCSYGVIQEVYICKNKIGDNHDQSMIVDKNGNMYTVSSKYIIEFGV